MIHSMQFVLANAPFLLERRFFFVQKLVYSNIRHLPGFILMDKVPVGRAIMAIVWVGHIVYFGFKVQTITQQEADDAMAQALEE